MKKYILHCFIFCFIFSFALQAQVPRVVSTSAELMNAVQDGARIIELQRNTVFLISNQLTVQASTNIIRSQPNVSGQPKLSRAIIRATNGSRRLFLVRGDNTVFQNLIMRGVQGSRDPHQAIFAGNVKNLRVTNCLIEDFGIGVISRQNVDRLEGWRINRCVFRNISLRNFAINRTGDGSSTAVAGRFMITNNTFERTFSSDIFSSETRGISIDGGNRGISVFDCRNSVISGNTFRNVSLAFSRVRNVIVNGSNRFIADLPLQDELLHIEELCNNIEITGNTFDHRLDNPNFSMIDMNGSNDIDIRSNTAIGLPEHFVRATRYNNRINIVQNNLNDVVLPNGVDEIITIEGCGGNAININNNNWNNRYIAFVRLGTYFWNRFDDLSLFSGPLRQSDINNVEPQFRAFVNMNFYYRCQRGENCGTPQLGTVRGNDPRRVNRTSSICGRQANFFGNTNTRPVNTFPAQKVLGDIDEKITNVSLYPNPVNAQHIIRVDGDLPVDTVANVYDFTGKLIYNQTLTTDKIIDLSTVNSKGMFLIQIVDNNKSEVIFADKLIVQN